jgi:hypothetical protein
MQWLRAAEGSSSGRLAIPKLPNGLVSRVCPIGTEEAVGANLPNGPDLDSAGSASHVVSFPYMVIIPKTGLDVNKEVALPYD